MSSISTGPWLAPPEAADILEFRLHVGTTGRPETFRGVRTTGEKPPIDGTAHYVAGFGVDPRLRDRESVPCSICSGKHPKFYEGALIWAPTGHLYLVGHRCARSHFGEQRYASMRADTRYATRLGDADATLILRWADVQPLMQFIDQVRPIAQQVEGARERLRGSVPNMLRALLRYARSHDQQMKLSVAPSANVPMSRAARSMLSEETFAPFQGLRLIEEKKFMPAKVLADLQEGLPPALLNSQTMEDYVRTLPEPNRLMLARNLLDCPRQLKRLIAEMNEAALFVSPPHLRQLAEWTAQARAGVHFRVTANAKHEGAYEFRQGSENVLMLARTIQAPTLPIEDPS
jgi:hypothetical protein